MKGDEFEPLGFDEAEDSGEPQKWLVTYADLVTLLLTFFVMLFSMSTLDKVQFTDSFTAIKQALSGKDVKVATAPVSAKEASILMEQIKLRREIQVEQRKVYSEVKFLQSTKGVEGLITATLDKGKITLRLPSDVLFASGSSTLKPEAQVVLLKLRSFFIKHVDQSINIKGFTDNVPPRPGARFNDNWELSSLRAVNVLRFFVRQGISPNRMTATGLADLDPLFPNTTPENRAKNRRVEFVLEKIVN